MLKEELKEQIKIYKLMIVAYGELLEEETFSGEILNGKKGTLNMVIEDLEKILRESD